MNIDSLCSGVFSDIMDSLNYKNQIITGYSKNQNVMKFMGRARTLEIETIETSDENISKGLGFLAQLGQGEILIVKGSDKFAYFGELMTRLSIRQGVKGVVIGGLTRDTNFTHDNCKLPILAKGYSPVDIKGRGRVLETDVDITVDGVKVHKNDLIFVDNEAICIIPNEIEEKVLKLVELKIVDEEKTIKLIDEGISVEDLLKEVKEF